MYSVEIEKAGQVYGLFSNVNSPSPKMAKMAIRVSGLQYGKVVFIKGDSPTICYRVSRNGIVRKIK